MMGEPAAAPVRFRVKCASGSASGPDGWRFQRGVLGYDDTGRLAVRSTGGQGSGILSSMHEANCFIVLPLESDGVAPGSEVDVEPFGRRRRGGGVTGPAVSRGAAGPRRRGGGVVAPPHDRGGPRAHPRDHGRGRVREAAARPRRGRIAPDPQGRRPRDRHPDDPRHVPRGARPRLPSATSGSSNGSPTWESVEVDWDFETVHVRTFAGNGIVDLEESSPGAR